MISLINGLDISSFRFADEFLMTKIKANLLSYGDNPKFLNLWCQICDSDITALICKMEQNVIIVSNYLADFDEIKDFLKVIGFETLSAEPYILHKLGLKFTEYQVVLKIAEKGGDLPPMPNIKGVFETLYSEENPHIKRVNFEGFYVDLNHRIRHNTASAVLVDSAVCIASHITDESAVISGVVTLKSARKSGLGSAVLRSLINGMDGRKIFAATKETTVPFYIKNGFKTHSKTAIFNVED